MTDDKCRVEFNCPVCNPPPKHDPDIVKAMQSRLDVGQTNLPDYLLMREAIREIGGLRTQIRTLSGQLQHIGGLATTTVDNVKRNLRIDGGWSLD